MNDLIWDSETNTLRAKNKKLTIQSTTSDFDGEFNGPYTVLKTSRGSLETPTSIESGDFLGGIESVSYTGKKWAWGGVAGFKQDNQYDIDPESDFVPTEFIVTVSDGKMPGILTHSLVFESTGTLLAPGFQSLGKEQHEIDELTKIAYPGTAAGAIVFNLTTKKHQAFDGTTWHDLY